MRGWTLAALLALTTGCDTVRELVKNPPELPAANLRQVDLVKAPSFDDLAAWTCFDFGGSGATCGLLGWDAKPARKDMQFGFDLVFDLFNPNSAFGIPLVELLLGFVVYDDQNLGAICVSFCDPSEADCDPASTPEDACKVDTSEDIDGIDDLVPTVDDLLDLADDVLDGSVDENFHWRTIPKFSEQMCHDAEDACVEEEVDGVAQMCCGDTCEPLARGCTVGEGEGGDTCALCDGHVEAHIAFDLEIDTMLGILETLFEDAVDALLAGRAFDFVIPYSVDGTVFFDVPKLGREALGFGPFDSTWAIVE